MVSGPLRLARSRRQRSELAPMVNHAPAWSPTTRTARSPGSDRRQSFDSDCSGRPRRQYCFFGVLHRLPHRPLLQLSPRARHGQDDGGHRHSATLVLKVFSNRTCPKSFSPYWTAPSGIRGRDLRERCTLRASGRFQQRELPTCRHHVLSP